VFLVESVVITVDIDKGKKMEKHVDTNDYASNSTALIVVTLGEE
jgi:hypothetical protein